jgi:molybdopterin/thiamine biosynthesis adenylyltransferase
VTEWLCVQVGSNKSTAAARACLEMNPAMRIDAREDKVAPDTERVYDDAFFKSMSCVVNALDNVEARLYVDQRCLSSGRPLLESGTLGTKVRACGRREGRVLTGD